MVKHVIVRGKNY